MVSLFKAQLVIDYYNMENNPLYEMRSLSNEHKTQTTAMIHKHHPYIFVTGTFCYEAKNKDHERVPVCRTDSRYVSIWTYVKIDMSP